MAAALMLVVGLPLLLYLAGQSWQQAKTNASETWWISLGKLSQFGAQLHKTMQPHVHHRPLHSCANDV